MPVRLVVLLLAAVLCGGCASLGQLRDDLCPEILRFANSLPQGDSRSVELCVSWGSGCTEDANVIMSKACEHGDYEPGAEFCDHLIKRTSSEFANVNFSRSLACLGRNLYRPERYYDYKWGDASISTDAMPGLAAGVSVTVNSEAAAGKLPAKLRFTATRN